MGSHVGGVSLSQTAALRCDCTTTPGFITQAAFTSHLVRTITIWPCKRAHNRTPRERP